MDNKPLLPFISNDKLVMLVKAVLGVAETAAENAEANLYSNIVDPFSAVFDASRQDIPLTQWLEQEKARQIQKTMQNALGTFHQAILGSMPGWEDMGTGNLVDVRSLGMKVVAEVKNKYNTTKGSDKKSIYDNLKSAISTNYQGFKGYYVEIIPKSPVPYDKPFMPSDNVTSARRPEDPNIRMIDGRGFYALASGLPNALDELYQALPTVISRILNTSPDKIKSDPLFSELFKRVYTK